MQTSQDEQLTRVVIFTLGDEYYGIDAAAVQEIRRMELITPIPRTSEYILGVVNLRSQVAPVICLRRRFGLAEVEHTKYSRIIVVEHGDARFGLVVDSVQEVAKVPHADIDKAPPAVAVKGEFIAGVYRHGQKITVLLDISSMLPGKGNDYEVQG